MAGPTLRIEAPTRPERMGGIRKIAEFRQNDRVGNAEAVVFQSDGCTFPYTEEVRCFADAPQPDKAYVGIQVDGAIGAPFTLVAGVACFVNADSDELVRAQAAFDGGKDRVLEEIVGVWAQGGTSLGTKANLNIAIASVEQELDDKYLGRGVILMSRFDAVLADGLVAVDSNGVLHTRNGTPVIASGRIEPGTVSGTGAITVEHTATNGYEATDFEKNQHYAMAEAIFVLAVDCEFRVTTSVTV